MGRMRLLVVAAILIAGVFAATAGEVLFSGLGNGYGWNDGAYYTGYVTLGFDGKDYAGLCVDALHDTYGNSWDAAALRPPRPRRCCAVTNRRCSNPNSWRKWPVNRFCSTSRSLVSSSSPSTAWAPINTLVGDSQTHQNWRAAN